MFDNLNDMEFVCPTTLFSSRIFDLQGHMSTLITLQARERAAVPKIRRGFGLADARQILQNA